MQRWEHKVTVDEAEALKLGEEGWELVTVVPLGHTLRFYLKRPAPSLREQITLEQRAAVLDGQKHENAGGK